MERQDAEKQKRAHPALLLLPVLILIGLLLAPPTRSLLRMQSRLLYNTALFRSRLREMGAREVPLPAAPKWEETPLPAQLTRSPDDYAVQLGGLLLKAIYTDDRKPQSSQEAFEIFQRRYGVGLQRGVPVIATLLTIAYAGVLIATARLESRANTAIVSRAHNGIAYLQQHP